MQTKVLSQKLGHKYSYILHIHKNSKAQQYIFQSLLLPKPVERVPIVQFKKILVTQINIEQQNQKTIVHSIDKDNFFINMVFRKMPSKQTN